MPRLEGCSFVLIFAVCFNVSSQHSNEISKQNDPIQMYEELACYQSCLIYQFSRQSREIKQSHANRRSEEKYESRPFFRLKLGARSHYTEAKWCLRTRTTVSNQFQADETKNDLICKGYSKPYRNRITMFE